MNSHIINYTAEGKIRVDLSVGIGYGEDMQKARELQVLAHRARRNAVTDKR